MIFYALLTMLAMVSCSLMAMLSPSVASMQTWFPSFTAAVMNGADYLAILWGILPMTTLLTVAAIALAFEAGVVIYGFTLFLLKKFRILG